MNVFGALREGRPGRIIAEFLSNRRSSKRKFTEIYRNNFWGNPESRSGSGSDLEQTTTIRNELPRVFEQYQIKSLADIPCGDFRWMQAVQYDFDHYYGGDIVDDVIDKNLIAYGSNSRTFLVIDILKDLVPEVDAILCRDCFVHFSNDDVIRALSNISRSGAKYLLATTFAGRRENKDIETGDWRTINLETAPFSLPRPLSLINENCTEDGGIYADKSIGVWSLAQIRQVMNLSNDAFTF